MAGRTALLAAFFTLVAAFASADRPLLTINEVVDNDVAEFDTELTPEDFAEGQNLEEVDLNQIGIEVKADPTLGNKVEGDMAIQNLSVFVNDSNKLQRNAIRSRWRRWPAGEIPYVLSSRYGSYSRRVLARAFDQYHEKTCIKFVPRDSSKHRDYLYIHPDDGCYSLVGRTGGRQPLSLDAGCIQTGTIIHELMHSVGFFHEQSRSDRDDWIQIVWKNVMYEAQDQFEKYSLRTITHLEQPYDYASIMHYGPYAFSRNSLKTILPKKSGGERMGQRTGFSNIDLLKINKLYYCDEDRPAVTDPPVVTEAPEVSRKPMPGPSACVDHNWRCMFWAMGIFDYCRKYREVREEICPKACGTCSSNRETDSHVSTRSPTTNRPPMITQARTTMGLAATTAPSNGCRDRNPACGRWAKKGHCNWPGYTDFMKDTCPKSCDECSTDGKSREQENSKECADNPQYETMCTVASLFDRCDSERNRDSLRKNCKKTCGFCE